MLQKIGLLVILFFCQSAHSQEDSQTQTELASQVRNLSARASRIVTKLNQQKSVMAREELLAAELTELKDWITGQNWELTTTITTITTSGSRNYLHARCDPTLSKQFRDRAVYERGGFFAHAVRIAIPQDAKDRFRPGEKIVFSGVTLAVLGTDDAPDEFNGPRLPFLDLIMPPIGDSAPQRLELSLDKVVIQGDHHRLDLSPASAGLGSKSAANEHTLDSALRLIKDLAEECQDAARKQQDTAAISQVLAEHRYKMKVLLSGQQWKLRVTAHTTTGAAGMYTIALDCHKSLAKFYGNDAAESRGGIRSYDQKVFVDRHLAELVAQEGEVAVEGTILVVEDNDVRRRLPHDGLTLFSVYLPPLDNRPPEQVSFQLINIAIKKCSGSGSTAQR